MVNIAVLISGGGTNLQAILDAAERGEIKKGKVALVISSKADAYGLKRAEKAGVPTKVISKKDYTKSGDFEEELIRVLQENEIGLVVLAGFMVILNQRFTRAFAGKIINVHPSLIPSFCGDGFYGLKVHEKALEYGVKVTGATVHFVNEVTDGGEIILQDCVPVQEEDTPQSLQKKSNGTSGVENTAESGFAFL